MPVTILTKEDLLQFKAELFAELKTLIAENPSPPQKKWLKSYEVREMLGISRGTLQHMKDSRVLNPSLIGGLLFYDHSEIEKLMQSTRQKKH